jgi:hypothetical protein
MALKKEVIEKIKSYGFDVDKLIEAIKADAETDYPVPEFVAISQKDLEARDANKVEEGKKLGSKDGEKDAIKTLQKELSKKLGFDLKGERVGDIAQEIQSKLNATENEKLQELTTQNNLLKQDKETLLREKTDAEKRAQTAMFDSELITHFPSTRSTKNSDAEYLALLKMNLQFETVDGKTIVKRNGEVVRDKNSQNPLAPKDVISTLFAEKDWVTKAEGGTGGSGASGGRGGGDSTAAGGAGSGSGIKKYSGFVDQWKKDNPEGNTMSPQFTDALSKHAKDIPDFDYYN